MIKLKLKKYYHVNLPPEACASLNGFLAATGDLKKPINNK